MLLHHSIIHPSSDIYCLDGSTLYLVYILYYSMLCFDASYVDYNTRVVVFYLVYPSGADVAALQSY